MLWERDSCRLKGVLGALLCEDLEIRNNHHPFLLSSLEDCGTVPPLLQRLS